MLLVTSGKDPKRQVMSSDLVVFNMPIHFARVFCPLEMRGCDCVNRGKLIMRFC